MIKCHLSRIMGEKKMKVIDVARMTNINRGTITRLYNEDTVRIDLEVIDVLCETLDITMSDLFEYIPNQEEPENNKD